MAKGGKAVGRQSSRVDAFLQKVQETKISKAAGGPGRLMFALDATASREPTWDKAAAIQGLMFKQAALLGGLAMQLVFFRGFGEFRASPWLIDSNRFLKLMASVFCAAGETQIAKVLQHAITESASRKINALVYVGDCMEEDLDQLGALAGQLGLIGVPAFMFHEGSNAIAAYGFQQIAKLSGGAYCSFDASSADALGDLLGAAAAFAAGGHKALKDLAGKKGGQLLMLTRQLKGG